MTKDEFLTAWRMAFGYNAVPHAEAIQFKRSCGFGSEKVYLTELGHQGYFYRDLEDDIWYLAKENSNET